MSESEISSLLRSLKEKANKIQEAARREIDSYQSDEENKNIINAQKKNRKKEQLENETINQLNMNLEADRKLKEKYAFRTLWFMIIFICVLLFITALFPLAIPIFLKWTGRESYLDLLRFEIIPLDILAYTIPASMALFAWVLKGLFPANKK